MSMFRNLMSCALGGCSHPLLKDILTYRTYWKEWALTSNVDAKVSQDGLTLRIDKFVPSAILLKSDIESPNNETLCSAFSNWKLKISGIGSLYESGKIPARTHTTWGGGDYTANGLTFTPVSDTGYIYIENFPWDLNVPNGSLKYPNRGYANYGYTSDGVMNVFDITSFPDRSSMIGGGYNLGLLINGHKNLSKFFDDFVTAKGSTKINDNCCEVNQRQPENAVVGTFLYGWSDWGSTKSIQVKITGLQEGDVIHRIYRTATSGNLEFKEGEEITTDGVYTITPVSNAQIKAGLLLTGDTENISPIRVAFYDDGYDSDGYLDISDSPVTLTLLPTNTEYPLWMQECWERTSGNISRKKAKTVDNCLMKYYGGTIREPGSEYTYDVYAENPVWNKISVKVIAAADSDEQALIAEAVGGVDSTETPHVTFPDMSEITDLDDYDNMSLVIRTKDRDTSNYLAGWLSNKLASSDIGIDRRFVRLPDSGWYDYVNSVGGWILANDADHPLAMNVVALYHDSGHETPNFYAYNNTFSDYYNLIMAKNIAGAVVNYVKFIAGEEVTATSLQNTFASCTIGSFSVENTDGMPYVFIPNQMINTFAWSYIDTIPGDFIVWSNVVNAQYCFDYASVRQVLGSSHEILLDCHTLHLYKNGNRWPCPVDQERPEIVYKDFTPVAMQFINTSVMERFEPVINVKYGFKGSKTSGFYRMLFAANLEYVRIKGLNCDDWDFVNDMSLPKLNAECIQYMFDNVEDQITKPFNPDNVVEGNVPNEVTDDTTFDMVNLRSSKSVNGLKIICPETWRDKITPDMIRTANSKGWHVYIGDAEVTASSAVTGL